MSDNAITEKAIAISIVIAIAERLSLRLRLEASTLAMLHIYFLLLRFFYNPFTAYLGVFHNFPSKNLEIRFLYRNFAKQKEIESRRRKDT